MSNFLSESLDLFKQKKLVLPEKSLMIICLIKDLIIQDMVVPDELVHKYNAKLGEVVKAGTAPRLACTRSEIYWLLIAYPMIMEVFRKEDIKLPLRLIVSNPENFMLHEKKVYLRHPVVILPKGNIQEAVAFMHDFAENGEKPERMNDFILRLSDFFEVHPLDGEVEMNKRCMVLTASTPNDMQLKISMAIALQKAEEKGAMIVEKPCYWFPNYIFDKYGYGDAKGMAEKLMPEYYPESYSGRDVEETVKFLKKHKHIVLKPSHGSNGIGVQFFDIRGLKTKALKKEIDRFRTMYLETLKTYHHTVRMIAQPFLEGIVRNGEVRIFVFDKKIMPIGIRLTPTGEDAICKIFSNATIELFYLTPEYIDIALEFIERAEIDVKYFGLDIIKSNDENGDEKLYMTEANFMVSGFYDRIAHKMDTEYTPLMSHIMSLDSKYHPHLIMSHLNDVPYKLFHQFLLKFLMKEEFGKTFTGLDILREFRAMRERYAKK